MSVITLSILPALFAATFLIMVYRARSIASPRRATIVVDTKPGRGRR